MSSAKGLGYRMYNVFPKIHPSSTPTHHHPTRTHPDQISTEMNGVVCAESRNYIGVNLSTHILVRFLHKVDAQTSLSWSRDVKMRCVPQPQPWLPARELMAPLFDFISSPA